MPEENNILKAYKDTLLRHEKEPVIDLDKKMKLRFDFQAQRLQDVLRDSLRSLPAKRWSYHQVVLIKRGHGEVVAGTEHFTARKNTLVILPSRVITSSKNWSEGTSGYVILFNLDFFLRQDFPYHHIIDKRILKTLTRPYLYLDQDKAEELSSIMETIILEKNQDKKYKNERIALKTIELLILSERYFSEANLLADKTIHHDINEQFIRLLEKYFNRERNVSFYATKLHIHPNYLNAVIKEHTGLTTKESIQRRILLEAKYLLHATGLSIKEIGYELGFEDPNYFSVFFSKLEKISPQKYRSIFL